MKLVHPQPRMLAVNWAAIGLGEFALHEVSVPVSCPNETLVRVAAVSMGHDDVTRAMTPTTGVPEASALQSDSDLAGTVEVPARDGSGPPAGTRVAGLVRTGAWAQFAAVPSDALAEIPSSVSFAQAAAIPTAGLTALYSLEHGSLLTAKQVLVTCAAGGVGLFAVQLAHLAGAGVVAVTAMEEHDALLEEYGAAHVVVGDVAGAGPFGPYHLVLTNAFGRSDLGPALALVGNYGTCVLYGTAGTHSVSIDEQAFIDRSIRLHGLRLFDEIRRKPAAEGLRQLLALAAEHALQPHIELEDAWTNVASVARRFLYQDLIGRAVMHL